MATGSWASVTDVSCTCGYLETCAADPNAPIRYDPDINEYAIVQSFEAGNYGSMCIYHCPFCGGRAPKSRREELFAVVPASEFERLRTVTEGIKSVDDAVQILGPPSSDTIVVLPPGYVPPMDRIGNATLPVRSINFEGLSDVANVYISVFSDNSIQIGFVPKYTGPLRKAV